MPNVWKVGSRWAEDGNRNASILSVFRRNNVVIVGAEKVRGIFLNEVKVNDYFAIADGYNVVAIAKAIDKPCLIKDLKVNLTPNDYKVFDYEECKEWAIGVRVKIVDLKPNDYLYYHNRGAFCSANQIWDEVKELYENYNDKFSIDSYTATLLKTEGTYKSLFDIHTKYIIPVFQRPYSWSENEIKPFITDLLNSFFGKDRTAEKAEPMFIGTLQFSEKKYIDNNEFEQEVIDGQQRITTLSILLKLLSIRYKLNEQLFSLNFNWLETRVNKEQNDYLTDFLQVENEDDLYNSENNKYFYNATLIGNIFNEIIANEPKLNFEIDKFCEFLFSKVYFVVIETFAGLSKTLQIFNTINTTGLDLNGGDLFKIRMYEYLTNYKNEDETAFDRISEVYQLIDHKNKEFRKSVTSIQGVLDIYKDILIAKYDLPDALFQFGWETFFDRLFDTILGIKDWENFSNVKNLSLELEDLKIIISIRFEWEQDSHEFFYYKEYENLFAWEMIWQSRYSRYSKIVYLLLFKYRNDKQKWDKVSKLMVVLNKLFFVYSVRYAKSIYDIHSLMYKVLRLIMKGNYDNAYDLIKEKLNSNIQNEFISILEGVIVDNQRKKNLICLLSAYMDELSIENLNIRVLQNKLFNTSFDIEHIHATADETHTIEHNLQNSIGNLVILESEINRSIKDAPFVNSNRNSKSKKEEYQKSKYKSVEILTNYDKWEQEEVINRRENEVKRIMSFLFEN